MKVYPYIRHKCEQFCDVRYYEDGWYLVSRSYCLSKDEFVQRKAKISFCPLCGEILPLLVYSGSIKASKTITGATIEDFKKAMKNWADSSAAFAGNGSYTTTQ